MLVAALVLLLMLLLVGALLLAATLLMMALMLLRPPRMTDGKAAYVLRRLSPGDLGLDFQELRIDVRDERSGGLLPLAAWWIPHPRAEGRCAVLIHGYADAKVGAIAWAPMWHALGYNILAFDLRAHGYSGGNFSTAGYFERHDVNQLLNQQLAERPAQMQQIVLFGVSLGAAVALAVAETRDDLHAVILECPYADYRHAVAAHAHYMNMPLPSFVPAAVRIAQWISGADFAYASPLKLIPRIAQPVMAIHAADDPVVWPEDAAAIEQAMEQRVRAGLPGTYWRIDGAAHVQGILVDLETYRQRITRFLEEISSTSRPAGGSGAQQAARTLDTTRH